RGVVAARRGGGAGGGGGGRGGGGRGGGGGPREGAGGPRGPPPDRHRPEAQPRGLPAGVAGPAGIERNRREVTHGGRGSRVPRSPRDHTLARRWRGSATRLRLRRARPRGPATTPHRTGRRHRACSPGSPRRPPPRPALR